MIWDAAVVGGGPAGAATAVHLARAGFAVVLADRSRFPRDKPCGEFLSPAATPLLEELGVREAVDAAGAGRIARVRIHAHGAAPLELRFPAAPPSPGWGYSLSRRRLDAILLEAARAAGVRVLEGARVEALVFEAGAVRGVDVRGPDGQPRPIHARLVVGAGGRNCPVARELGLRRTAGPRRYDLLAHWDGVSGGLEPECALHVGRAGYVAAAPVEDGRLNVNCVVHQRALRGPADPPAVYREALAGHAALHALTSGGSPAPLAASDVTPLRAPRATADGALLVGDSALFLDPFTGQGIYLALRSAALAAPVAATALRAGRTDRGALAAYDRRRAAEFDAKWRVSRALQAILYRPALARGVTRSLGRDPGLAAVLAAVTGDLEPASRAWNARYVGRIAIGALRTGAAGSGVSTTVAPPAGTSAGPPGRSGSSRRS